MEKEKIEVPVEIESNGNNGGLIGLFRSRNFMFDRIAEPSYFTILTVILRTYWILFFATGIIVFSAFLFVFEKSVKYQATVKFIITDWQQELIEGVGGELQPGKAPSQVLMTFYDDDAINQLIQENKLLKDEKNSSPLFEINLLHKISNNITIMESKFGSFELIFKWDDRYLVAELANDLVKAVEDQNKNMQKQFLEKKVALLKEMVQAPTNNVIDSMVNFDARIAKIDMLQSQLGSSFQYSSVLNELRSEVTSLTKDLEQSYNLVSQRVRISELAIETFSGSSFNSINIIQQAIPDFKKYVYFNIVKSGFLTIMLLLSLPVIIYLVRYMPVEK